MNIGDRVWTIKATAESENCYDEAPTRPTLRIITEIRNGLAAASSLRDDGTHDDDSNATCYLGPGDGYAGEADAWRAYASAMKREAARHKENARRCRTEVVFASEAAKTADHLGWIDPCDVGPVYSAEELAELRRSTSTPRQV